jgi:hypothetical protein
VILVPRAVRVYFATQPQNRALAESLRGRKLEAGGA